MSLARVWKRQLYGASSAALIVPSAMLAALMVLALGGGLESVGVLGQIFAGPRVPASSGPVSRARPGAGGRALSGAIPVIPVTVAAVPSRRAAAGAPRPAGHSGVAVSSGGSRRTGGAIAPAGGLAPVVTTRPGTPAAPSPARPAPGQTSGQPTQPSPPPPPPKPTPVDRVITVVTSVSQQVPAPAGPGVTQAMQSAGNSADGLLPPAPGTPVP